MSRGFDLIRRHLSDRLTGNKDAATKINDASGEDVASDTPWLDAVSGGVRQGLPLSARQAQTAVATTGDAADDGPLLTATEMLRRQIPKFLRPKQENGNAASAPGTFVNPGSAEPAPVWPEGSTSTYAPRTIEPAAQKPLQWPIPQAGNQVTARPHEQPETMRRPAPPSVGVPAGSMNRTASSTIAAQPTAAATAPVRSGAAGFAPPPNRPAHPGASPANSLDERRLRDRRPADQTSEDGQTHRRHAKAARRHSIFVAMMKGLLPSLVIGLVGVFFFYSYDFRPDILPDNVEFDPGDLSISSDGIKMVAPKLTGVDDKQQTFEVKADAAIQDRQDPAKVTLEGIDARINLKEGGTVGISAQHGIYNTDLNQIWLRDDLEIRSSEGYVAQLSEAQVDFKNGLMVSNQPVLIFTNSGVISASAVQVLEGGEKIKFSGPVVLNLNASTEDSAAQSAGETQ